jgi:hypothetical protein
MQTEQIPNDGGPRNTGWRIAPGSVRPDNGERIGRRKGTPNKVGALLKDEILQAAELEGDVDNHSAEYKAIYEDIDAEAAKRGGRLGWLRWLARTEPVAFSSLLGKILPTQVNVTAFNEAVYESVDQVREEMIKEGLSLDAVRVVLDNIEYREIPPPVEVPPTQDDQS